MVVVLRYVGIAATFLLLGSRPMQLENACETTATVKTINAFSLELLRGYATEPAAPANAVLSPQSIYHGLAMSYVASGGKTRKELTRCGFPDRDEELLSDVRDLRQQLTSKTARQDADVCLANSLWLDRTYAEFRKDYTERVRLAFGASLRTLRFSDHGSASSEINRWVAEQTRGRIRQVLSPRDLASRSRLGVIDEPALVTVSAVYFDGDWSSRFDKRATTGMPFHVDSETIADATMMHQSSNLSYAEDNRFQFLEIPYRGGAFSMCLLLPKSVLAARDILLDVTPSMIDRLKASAFCHEVDVLLPKFELQSRFDVKERLSAMGVEAAFDNASADFDRMIVKKAEAYRVYISQIFHDAWIGVDEDGTEAAAATTTVHFSVGCSASPRPMYAEFHADRPFVFLIVHNPSRSIVFGGWFSDPRSVASSAAP